MNEILTAALKNSIKGQHVHVDPMDALLNLNFEMASKLPKNSEHSCWHILYHIVYWQDLMLEALRGKKDMNWPKNNEASWLKNLPKDRENWDELVQRFISGIEEAYRLTEKIESVEALPSWPKVPPFRALMVLSQHNSYHIGQIVTTRQILGFWPPTSEYKTF
ncbi:MAG: DinB family protein [Candidatus Thorarchaeota archaeon]